MKNSRAVWDQYINEYASDVGEAATASPPVSPESATAADSVGIPGITENPPEPDAAPLLLDDSDDVPDDMIDPVSLKLDEIERHLERLGREFESKLKHDTHKNRVIDTLHRELQEYKKDVIKKQVKALIMDIIQFVDNSRKLAQHYSVQDASAADPRKLIRLLNGIPSNLEDVMGRQGVSSFTCEDSVFDPTRQRVLRRVETSDPSEDKTIAQRLHPGYEWDGDMIRPELVSVYVHREVRVEEVRDSDE
ncbi:nucleotide exchange factor GrpE [Desulfonema ishimotonii]|uniref:nucleotide exchange factor GrpE n=1 Tax=Desulfonema ishimotonii TaxID=45657 RepID=UPI00140C8C09|nr:nucleotide exchange factor GrpE [Desulfonema ishimotonii]